MSNRLKEFHKKIENTIEEVEDRKNTPDGKPSDSKQQKRI